MIGGCFLTVVGCECQALYFNACHGSLPVVCFWERFFSFFFNAVLKLLAKDYFYGGSCNSSHYLLY